MKEDLMLEEEIELWRADEVAELLGICSNTIYSLLKSGTLKGQKIGKGWLIRKQDLLEFLNPEKKKKQ